MKFYSFPLLCLFLWFSSFPSLQAKESGKNKCCNLDERDCRDVADRNDSIACSGRGAICDRSVIAARSNCSSYSCPVPKEKYFKEIATGDDWYQSLLISKVLYQKQTKFQKLIIFENPTFGRVLGLDGIVQLTQADEPFYHEMIAHVPILAHGSVRSVLIIGGGDGGTAREVLRHKGIEKVVMVEIDGDVVEASKKYLPTVSNNAFQNPRLHLKIQDGIEFVKTTTDTFDLIICDSTDPQGPGEVLFTPEFYKQCKKILTKGGIVVTQNGESFDEGVACLKGFNNLRSQFKEAHLYLTSVPTYIGGHMTFGFATDTPEYFHVSIDELTKRLQPIEGQMQYYNPAVHIASFALPEYIQTVKL